MQKSCAYALEPAAIHYQLATTQLVAQFDKANPVCYASSNKRIPREGCFLLQIG